MKKHEEHDDDDGDDDGDDDYGAASLVVSESAWSLSSAFLHQALLHDLFIQTDRPQLAFR
ncbi:MAG TPA: hypothetical protein VOA64_01550 [Candidatus Dormibacteraeota bacterium]|nr:hypothetical protein [Candidatus Dormibacteraeota bacterium]